MQTLIMGESSVTGLQPGKTEQYLCHTLNVIAAILDDALRLVQPQCFRRVVQNGGNGRRIALLKQLIRRPQASWLFDVELRVAIYILSFSPNLFYCQIKDTNRGGQQQPRPRGRISEDSSQETEHGRLQDGLRSRRIRCGLRRHSGSSICQEAFVDKGGGRTARKSTPGAH